MSSGPLAATDGPSSVYRPQTDAQWTALSLPVPNYYFLCQDAAGSLAEKNGGTALTLGGASHLFQQTVTGWSALHVGLVNTTANQRWMHAAAAGIDPSTTSLAVLAYMSVVATAAERRFVMYGTNSELRISTAGVVGVRCNGVQVNGAGNHAGLTTVHPFLLVYNRTATSVVCYTDLEQITGTYAAITDSTKGIGTNGGTAPDARCNLVAMWSGANAESLGKATLTTLNWSLSY